MKPVRTGRIAVAVIAAGVAVVLDDRVQVPSEDRFQTTGVLL